MLICLSPRNIRGHSMKSAMAYLEMLCTTLGSSGIWVSRTADDRNSSLVCRCLWVILIGVTNTSAPARHR